MAQDGASPLKQFKKIPVHVVEEHNDALQFVYAAIGGKKLPVEGTTLVHLDSHPDMLISRELKGSDARSGKKLLELLQIENWIVPAAAAGHLSRVVWLRPPWAKQLADGTRVIGVGDHPETGLLRVDSPEPYYLSDALFSRQLRNKREFTLTVAELGDPDRKRQDEMNHTTELTNKLEVSAPYVLDIDLDFFSTDNPFLSLYESILLYDRLEPIFGFQLPDKGDLETVEKVVELRERQLQELEKLCLFLEEHGSLNYWGGVKSELYSKVGYEALS